MRTVSCEGAWSHRHNVNELLPRAAAVVSMYTTSCPNLWTGAMHARMHRSGLAGWVSLWWRMIHFLVECSLDSLSVFHVPDRLTLLVVEPGLVDRLARQLTN